MLQREAAHDGAVLDVDTWDGEEGGLAVSCGVDRTIRVWAMRDVGDGREEGDEGREVETVGEEEDMVEEGDGEDLDI